MVLNDNDAPENNDIKELVKINLAKNGFRINIETACIAITHLDVLSGTQSLHGTCYFL